MIKRINEMCCGCSLCSIVCPQKCIEMKEDAEGFLFPHVDENKCTNCNVCEMQCPVINKVEHKSIQEGYIARSKDPEVLKNSASGGFFSPLAEHILENEGVVCAATFNENWIIHHKVTDKKADLSLMRGSKYVQSDISECFTLIKQYLEKEKTVLFCGTPCQVQAIMKHVQTDVLLDHLITVDMVCKGVASPGYWNQYLTYQTQKYDSEIKAINFRKKVHGYHSPNLSIVFQNGKESSKSKTDYFMKTYVNEYCSRESCYQCQFKGIDHCSDFTIFDAWHASDVLNGVKDDDKGYTTIIVHNLKAKTILNELQNKLKIMPINIHKAISLDGIMVNNQPTENSNRRDFLKTSIDTGIEKAIEKYCPITIKEILVEKLKDVLYSLGILQLTKKLFKRRK